MRSAVWCLAAVAATLFSPGRSDCHRDCLACGLLVQPDLQLQQAFSTMVCLLECERHDDSSFIWDLCRRVTKGTQYPSPPDGGDVSKRAGGVQGVSPGDLPWDGKGLLAAASERYLGAAPDSGPFTQSGVQYDSWGLGASEEDERLEGVEDEELSLGVGDRKPRDQSEDGDDRMVEDREDSDAVHLSKRFGGFLRGRQGYRKLISSPVMMRPLQKRYGGFIGVRKSARKWNSQKRVNQLLRQYLGLRSSRAGRFTGLPSAALRRPNQL